jgi:hypothetical protein
MFLFFDFFTICPYTTEQWLAYHWWYAFHSLRNPYLNYLSHKICRMDRFILNSNQSLILAAQLTFGKQYIRSNIMHAVCSTDSVNLEVANITYAGLGRRADLRPFGCWDRGFESHALH